MARKLYVVEGAKLKCSSGTTLGKLKVTSQEKITIKNRLKATDKDKLLEPPFFGICSCTNKACSPTLKEWKYPSKKVGLGNKSYIMDNSQIECSTGGMVTIEDPNQTLAGTGRENPKLDKKFPELLGEIIFVNGFLSDPQANSEQTLNNAIRDINPDNADDKNYKQGESVNERNRADDDDIFSNSELEELLPEKGRTDKVIQKALKLNSLKTPFSFNNDVEKFWGYWNSISNKFKASDIYGNYFNAYRNDHYINGSHGLGSNAAHRIDHGIALGYRWAEKYWFLMSPEIADKKEGEESHFMQSFSPQYSPITIVAHSHGAAMGAGVAIGVIHYAAKQKWEKIALNIVFLGVHQPQNLTGTQYENFIDDKELYYEVNQNFPQLFAKEEKKGRSFLNNLADLFNRDYNKLNHERGIHEHLSKILGNVDEFKSRAVQFTFANDRGDAVTRDGDIPDINNACNPNSDFSLFCSDYTNPSKYLKPKSLNISNKRTFPTPNKGKIYLSKYIANRRFDFGDINKKSTSKEKEKGLEWGSYLGVTLVWANSFEAYKLLKEQYEIRYNITFHYRGYVTGRINKVNEWLYDHNPFGDGYTEKQKKQKELYKKVTTAYETMLRNYAALQDANLYAHFSPVGLINHKLVLSDFPGDSLGKISILDRIQKAGEQKFYRVEYNKDPVKAAKMTPEQKREKEQKDIEGKLKNRLIDTRIANTDYIENVIKAFIGDDEKIKEKADEFLYHEPDKD